MLHEKPEELIKSSIESFEIEPDLVTLNRIEDTITKTNKERQSKIEALESRISKAQNDYKLLQGELELINKPAGLSETLDKIGKVTGISEPEEESDNVESDNIFKLMNQKSIELDNLKVSLAKKLNDVESQLSSLNITKINLTKQQQDLVESNQRTVNDNLLENFNSITMKINLFKNLGISIDQIGDKDKIIIYNKFEDTTSVLPVDDKYSDYFVTNFIWERI